jgi:ATP synthase protein I
MSGNDTGREPPSGEGSFEERLRAARQKQGLGVPRPPAADGAARSAEPSPMGIGLRVGVELVSALAVAVAIGWLLDRWLHTAPAFLVVFVFLGGGAGVANVWRLMGPKTPRR